jgi:PhzF family phenazine biosynthesis protein
VQLAAAISLSTCFNFVIILEKMSRTLPFSLLTAFAANTASGNPAAVIFVPNRLVDSQISDSARQVVGQNFAQPMTAFIVPAESDGEIDRDALSNTRTFDIRYFTSNIEFPLCGHATLAAAGALFADTKRIPSGVTELHFRAQTDRVIARRLENGRVEIALRAGRVIPVNNDDEREVQLREALVHALGRDVKISCIAAGQAHLSKYVIIEVETTDLASLHVNTSALVRSCVSVVGLH